jgi:phosphate transport system permease protein
MSVETSPSEGATIEHAPWEGLFDATAPLTPTGNLRRREAVSRLASGGARVAAVLALAVLGVVIFAVVKRGGSALSIDFLTKAPPLFGGSGGGIGPEIVGTLIIVGLAAAIATPVGVLAALFVTEFAGRRSAQVVRTSLDVMQGLPSIIVGLLVFGLLVAGVGQSGYAASIALAIIMLPLISRSSQEVLLLVPTSLRDAADALGVQRWRTVHGVVLPEALGGIVTGTILAVGRAAGETAPLIAIDSIWNGGKFAVNPFSHQGIPNIPFEIFTLSENPDPSSFQRAWGASLVLLVMILLANFIARALLARNRKRNSR